MESTDSPSSSTSSTSAPLKKRNKMLPLTDGRETPSKRSDEEAAAAALAGLNQVPKGSSDNTSGAESDGEDSISSRDSMPRPVHKPPVNNTMVDHTYTDYSVVDESLLSYLQKDDDNDDDSSINETERKAKEKAIKKIKKIFGDIAPTRKNSGGVVKPFPEKLMEVLDRGDMDVIITWLPHGRAFIVRHSQKLKEVVLPRFFKQSKFMSFTRQLNLWGFKRITKGTDAGAYYHELFLRGRPLLSTLMRRQKIKGTGIKLTPNPDTEPNFYKISEKRPLPASAIEKELEPLPPISTSLGATKNKITDNSVYANSAAIDLLLQQQRLEQSALSGLGQHQSMNRIGGGSFSGLGSHQSMFHDNLALNMLQREAHQRMPMQQRLSAPTTSTDFSLVAGSLQNKLKEQHAIASAQHLLNEVSSHTAAASNPIDDMKQKLLNAFHTLEQTQASSAAAAASPQVPPITQSLLGHGLGHQAAAQGLPSGLQSSLPSSHQSGLPPLPPLFPSQNPYASMNSVMAPHQAREQQHQQALLGQTEQPNRGSMAALMTALDQTRQVAAAAQAQSSLLQQVANDLALGRQNKK